MRQNARIFLVASTLVAVLFTEGALGATVPEVNSVIKTATNNGFSYLGAISSPVKSQGKARGISTAQAEPVTSYYFLSQNAAGFATAEGDCKASISDDATMLYIETQEEFNNITRFFATSDDTGSTYWVGAKYNPSKGKFFWNNDVEVGPWAPWATGHPNTKLAITRVFLSRAGGSPNFRTQFQTVSSRYICELKTGPVEEEPVPCYHDNDLVIVVDSSGSIARSDYEVALEFAARLATVWSDNPNNRLSVIVYSSYVQSIFTLGQHLGISQIRSQIYGAPYIGGGTASDLALNQALSDFQQNGRSVPRNLVFLTDGASNNGPATVAAAQSIQTAGIKSFSVGIGSWVGADELLAIAGGDSRRVFNTDGFDDLLRLLQPVSRRVCAT